jgi:hypothetical protein
LASLDIGEVVTVLSAISSIAVIAGAGFIVVQLRQNASLLNASLRQEKKEAAFSMLEELTQESFAKRRANFYRMVKKYKEADWKDFDDSPDDFEIRNLAYFYELHGQLVRNGTIDFPMVADMLQNLVIYDWRTFEPVSEHIMKRWGLKVSPWHNFEWLAKKTQEHIAKRQSASDRAA